MENRAFADALARARQLAAKLGQPPPGGNAQPQGLKRSAEDSYEEPEMKRLAPVNDPFGAQLAAMKQQGASAMGITTGLGLGGTGKACTEEIRIPDALVGLIIGRGGEQISKIQAETGCKVQVSPEPNPGKDRPVYLQGTKDSIERAKDMVMDIVTTKGGHNMGGGSGNQGGRGGGGLVSAGGGSTTVELLIPGAKVGLIIGKGGETIRQLQDKSSTKMYILQENMFEECDKPLRIVGDPDLVENARQMVMDLISEGPGKSDMSMAPRSEYGSGNDGGGGGGGMMRSRNQQPGPGMETMKFPVPKVSVGLIIGKGGDMIKRIQMETGAKVQFDPINSNMGDLDEQLAIITGKPDDIRQAQIRIEELVETALSGKQGGSSGGGGGRDGGGGRGFGGGGGDRDRWDGEHGGGGGGRVRRNFDGDEEKFPVPSNRVGMVIGKGGETIRQINQQSGAHCEIDRNGPQDGPEKVFMIRGTLQQIEHAKELIMEKVNTLPPKGQRGDFGGGQGGGQNWNQSGGYGNESGGWSDPSKSGDTSAQWAAYYAQYYGQAQAGNGATQDYTQQWIEYLRAQGQHDQANILEQQAKAAKGGGGQPNPSEAAPGTTNGNNNGQAAAPAASQAVDYSQQWAEHYRSIGKIAEAEAIENYIKAQKQGGGGGSGPQAQQQPGATPGTAPGYPNYYGGGFGTFGNNSTSASSTAPPGTEPEK